MDCVRCGRPLDADARFCSHCGHEVGTPFIMFDDMPQEIPLQEQFCPYYPMAKLIPDVPMDRFMQYVGANHYALVYEDVSAAAKYFAKYTGIELVC